MKLPRYLSGAIYAPLADYPDDFGFMRTPNMGNKNVPALPWAADNGCFSLKGERAFALDSYLAWLRDQDVTSCLFATAPDKVGDAAETIRRAAPAMPLIRELGYPVAFVAQNGLEQLEVPWDAFDVLFIGGTTEWKLGPAAKALALAARRAGKLVHNGRVNSYKRFIYSAQLGCSSVDGTYLCFGPRTNFPKLLGWIEKGKSCELSIYAAE
jgi:hypothetical protein